MKKNLFKRIISMSLGFSLILSSGASAYALDFAKETDLEIEAEVEWVEYDVDGVAAYYEKYLKYGDVIHINNMLSDTIDNASISAQDFANESELEQEIGIEWVEYDVDGVAAYYEKYLKSGEAEHINNMLLETTPMDISAKSQLNDMLPTTIVKGTSAPTQLHRLDMSDYYYDGSVSVTKGTTLYTSKYFLPNTSGKLYIEGWASIQENTNQNLKIFLYDKTAGTSGVVTISDYYNDMPGVRKLFYYNFGFTNLNTTHEYYIGFNTSTTPVFYSVDGYISHNWTNYYNVN